MGVGMLVGWMGGPEFDGWRDAHIGKPESNPHAEGTAAREQYRRGYTNYEPEPEPEPEPEVGEGQRQS